MRRRAIAACLFGALAAACSGAPPPGGATVTPQPVHERATAPLNLKLMTAPGRPRLALLTRDGDPAPALVAVIATDLDPATTAALSAVIEARLTGAGLAVDSRVDRHAFRVRLLLPGGAAGAASPKAFLSALSAAFRTPIGPGTPEVARAAERVAALRRNPLPAVEAVPAADCAGRLGLAPRQRTLDLLTPEGVRELEAARTAAFTAGRIALAVAGPAAACAAAERALAETEPWPEGPAANDAWPEADSIGTYAANDVARERARITVAVRAAEPLTAVAAAERLGDPEGPLRARLAALPLPFRVTEVVGIARPRGGCVSITAEAAENIRDTVGASALAAAVTRKEIALETAAPPDPETMARAIVAASDPRDAAARAAWWLLARSAQGSPERWATALALAPDERGAELSAAAKRFEAELAGAVRAADAPVVERRAALEQGQGEVWVLLASPCGTADEGPFDAGTSALAALAVSERARRAADADIEPWITPDGIGVLVHGPARGQDETSAAQRLAGAAARAFAGDLPRREAVADARALALSQIERSAGPHGAALDGLLNALAPDHPSQLHALGSFARLVTLGAPSVTARWQSLAGGPLRMAILANGGAAQANAAFGAADRWLAPRPAPRPCPATEDSSVKPGRYEVDLPPGSELEQVLLAAPVAGRGQAGRDLAELAAHLLGGERGLVQAALDRTSLAAVASVRLLGGARAAALVIDVRAPSGSLDDAVTEVKALLGRLGHDGPSDAQIDVARAKKERAEQDASFEPRSRLVKLWLGEMKSASPLPAKAAMQAFFAAAFRESALVLVEAKRK